MTKAEKFMARSASARSRRLVSLIVIALGATGCGAGTFSPQASEIHSHAVLEGRNGQPSPLAQGRVILVDSTTVSSTPPVTVPPLNPSPPPTRPQTLRDYLTRNQIVETPVHRGDPGVPNIALPFPPGWADAGPRTPDGALGAIVYRQPQDPSDPPMIVAVVSKLTGNVDPTEVLQHPSADLLDLPGYQPSGDPSPGRVSGFDATQWGGTYVKNGTKRIVTQKTVVIPDNGAVFVLQIKADVPDVQDNVVMAASDVIDEQTVISL